jgi:hypothetical protein
MGHVVNTCPLYGISEIHDSFLVGRDPDDIFHKCQEIVGFIERKSLVGLRIDGHAKK